MRARRLGQSLVKVLALTAALLILAACGKTQVYREGSARPGSASSGRSVAKPGKSVTVQRGDSLYKIGRSHGISALDLALWNGIEPPYTIHPGQRLRLYPSNTRNKGQASAARPPTTRPAQTTPTQPAAQPPARSPFKWRWPTEGQVVTRFNQDDATRQGVDIGGKSGQPVRASADGLVVYSGAGLVGYGELVIIKHDEQWLTAYGHNRSRLVSEGARVKAGDTIAEMGRTGAARDMLHFEIRYNGRPVDPLLYLPAR